MERPPYIDEMMTNVRSNREQTWPALLGVLRGSLSAGPHALLIEVDDLDGGASRVRARTYAAFPGVTGRAYRALVIGSGAHRT